MTTMLWWQNLPLFMIVGALICAAVCSVLRAKAARAVITVLSALECAGMGILLYFTLTRNESFVFAMAAILKILTEGENPFQSATELADKLGVSTKTVSRELPAVAEALKPYGLDLSRKKGAGFTIDGGEEAMESLRKFLGQVNDKTFSPEERRSIIVSRLLPHNEPVKLFTLASLLGVTDGTISNDLDKLESWFKGHGLRLVRKPGLGVYIEGKESSIRQAIVAYIYENVGEQELLSLVQANLAEDGQAVSRASSHLLDLVDKEIIQRLERLIRQTEKSLDGRLSDQAFVGLLVHLALAVQRIRRHEPIKLAPEVLADLKSKAEFKLAVDLGAKIAQEFAITINEAETGYIAMHILGVKRMLVVSIFVRGCSGCLRPPWGITPTSLPSTILSNPCCTPSPDTSRVIDTFSPFLASLSTSSRQTMPTCAR